MKTIAGQPAADEIAAYVKANATPSKIQPGCFESESLCRAQAELHRQGYREAEIYATVYGFSLRYSSGLDNFGMIKTKLPTLLSALAASVEWVKVDPLKRTVCVRGRMAELLKRTPADS